MWALSCSGRSTEGRGALLYTPYTITLETRVSRKEAKLESPEVGWCGSPTAVGSDPGHDLESTVVPQEHALEKALGQKCLLYWLVIVKI